MNSVSRLNIYSWLIVILLLLLEIPVVLWVQYNTGVTGETKEEARKLKSLADALGLTEKQLDLFVVNEKEYSKLIDTLHQQINIKNKEITDKIFQENYDDAGLNQLIEEAGRLNDEVEKVRFKYLRKLRSVLKKQQQIKFREIINESLIECNDTLIVRHNRIYPPRARKIF